MSNVSDIVADYIARGWAPIRVKPLHKNPLSKAWQNTTPQPHEFQACDNVGVKLGSASGGLIDLDLDSPQSRALAREEGLFAGLPAFGREGQSPGHLLAMCKDAPEKASQCYLLPPGHGLQLAKNMILEVRASNQTVFPPSKYQNEDGTVQSIVWASGQAPATIPELSWKDLEQRADILALLSVVAAAYPDKGNRDNLCMVLGGVLARLEIPVDIADNLIVAVARHAGDDEANKRGGKASAAATKIAAGDQVTGLPTLLEMLGLSTCEKTIRKWLNLKSEQLVAAPGSITMQPGQLNAVVDQAEASLLASKFPIYQRGQELMRVTRLGKAEEIEGVRRTAGVTMLYPVHSTWLTQSMARAADWYSVSEDGIRPADPGERYAKHLLARTGEWKFPELKAIVTAPTLDKEGRVIQKPGFDAASGLLLDFEEGAFPEIPEQPTMLEAQKGLDQLRHLIEEFPFVNDAARAVALLAMLTVLVRASLSTAPLHAFGDRGRRHTPCRDLPSRHRP
jgi:hypothetical protein